MWEAILAALVRIGRFFSAGCASCFPRRRDEEPSPEPAIHIQVVVQQESPHTPHRHHHGHHHPQPSFNLTNGEFDALEGGHYMHSYLRPRHFHNPETLKALEDARHQLALEEEAIRSGTYTHQGGPARPSAFE